MVGTIVAAVVVCSAPAVELDPAGEPVSLWFGGCIAEDWPTGDCVDVGGVLPAVWVDCVTLSATRLLVSGIPAGVVVFDGTPSVVGLAVGVVVGGALVLVFTVCAVALVTEVSVFELAGDEVAGVLAVVDCVCDCCRNRSGNSELDHCAS